MWTSAEFAQRFGRPFDQAHDSVALMNADYDTCPHGVSSVYRPGGLAVAAVLTTTEYRGNCRLNYVVALGV